jgi:LytS/YehU family sensor histidine kinase
MQVKLYLQIPIVITGSFINAGLFYFGQYFLEKAVHDSSTELVFIEVIANIINYAFVFFFWSLSYFSYHFLLNFTQAEMNSLRMQATMKETELNKIKSQLNPHFMFNSMNSIRALIDEDPSKAKEAVTQLSNILRNTLMMEKNKLIPFEDEMKIVNDYLNLEKIRFEERLAFNIESTPETASFVVPPLLLQTLVENGIKHGISKLTRGGEIDIRSSVKNDILTINIRNTGVYNKNKTSDSGFGLKNSLERLNYLFGEKGTVTIENEDEMVLTKINIPRSKEIR